ncbi:MAG: phosphoribosylglycinamide formyltransferase, partial [Clostridia bacterium]|nr:phosphoribosylglycinamide formyltransferase [Clostridia bacterium]
MKKTKIAVLISGGGTNLQALIDAEKSGTIKSGEIVCVISSQPDAYGLVRAKNADIPTAVVSKKLLGSQDAFEERIISTLNEYGAELIILAGFMSILTEKFTSRYPERIINVHPALIPSFCGKGFYGLHV